VTEQKVALIVGAAGDIGRAIAVGFAHDGWTVALHDHPAQEDALATLAAECRSSADGSSMHLFDLSAADLDEQIEQCIDRSGVPLALVNAAGVQGTFAPVQNYPVDDVRTVFDINVIALFRVLGRVSAAMIRAARGGAIVNVASMAGVSGAPNMPAYSAAKAAVVGLTKSAAKDLAPFDIRVNAVSPAFIGPGRMWDNQVRAQAAVGSQYYSSDPTVTAAEMISMIPLRRVGTTQEVARVVQFLASDDASYITGVNLEVSGGSV
jgi:NAD(P)-dependent dehydrogenase (short-subunit alcohol dehydrogenase family)